MRVTSLRSPLVALGASFVGLTLAGLAAQAFDRLDLTVGFALLHGALYGAAAWLLLSGRAGVGLGVVVLVAALLRLPVLVAPLYHSDDIYRYVWDGRVQAAGINPYRYVPIDPALEGLRDGTIYPHINRVDYAPTIYPPVAQMFFLAVTRFGETVLTMKAAIVLLEAIGMVALWRLLHDGGLPTGRLLLYAWHPLPVWEFAGSGHIDAAVIALLPLAILASRRGRPVTAGVAIAAAVLTKFLPAAVLPALWRPLDWRLPAAFVATVLLAYLPYLGAGPAVLGFLPAYFAEEGLQQGHGLWLLAVLRSAGVAEVATPYFLAAVAALLAALAIAVAFAMPERERPIVGSCLLATAATLAISPHFAWYFAWLLPLICLVPYWPLLWLPTASFVLYLGDPRTVLWIGAVLYGGFAALVTLDVLRRRLGTRTPEKFA